jgi:hypothetical protein
MDKRFSLRHAAQESRFAAICVLTLALGSCGPLSYRDPSSLVVVSLLDQKSQEPFPPCEADFLDCRTQNQAFTAVAAFFGNRFKCSGAPEEILGDPVTADFFSTLGIKPALGRTQTV